MFVREVFGGTGRCAGAAFAGRVHFVRGCVAPSAQVFGSAGSRRSGNMRGITNAQRARGEARAPALRARRKPHPAQRQQAA
jgi:hypothetical protein